MCFRPICMVQKYTGMMTCAPRLPTLRHGAYIPCGAREGSHPCAHASHGFNLPQRQQRPQSMADASWNSPHDGYVVQTAVLRTVYMREAPSAGLPCFVCASTCVCCQQMSYKYSSNTTKCKFVVSVNRPKALLYASMY